MSKYVITIPVYNAGWFVERAIVSALDQDHSDFRIVVSDDASTDGTFGVIRSVVQHRDRYPKPHIEITVIRNHQNVGPLGNHCIMADVVDPGEIIVTLDGDDALKHSAVLPTLDRYYSDPNTWMTYGSFEYDYHARNPDLNASPRGFMGQVPPDNHSRRAGWSSSHLRTYYKWLFAKVDPADFLYHGRPYPMAGDLALMWPLIELAGPQHAKFVQESLYLYNAAHPLNEDKAGKNDLINEIITHLQSQPIYAPLSSPDAPPTKLN